MSQDGSTAYVALTMSDRFCLNGRRLRLTSSTNLSTYGQAGTTYQTEVTDFSNVTANGTQGNGPAYFTVKGKDGLTYYYGFVDAQSHGAYSQVYASGTTTVMTWLLSKVTDRDGNAMVVDYLNGTGSANPDSIYWTLSTAGGTTYNYKVKFTYGANAPPSSIYGYVAGTAYSNTSLLSAITISYVPTTAVVKKYALTYQSSPTTGRKEMTQVKECADDALTNCLSPTVITYQGQPRGIDTPALTAVSTATVNRMVTGDLNGDGKYDIAYPVGTGTTVHWWVVFATGSGFGSPVDTGINTGQVDRVLIDDYLGEGFNSLLMPQSGVWYAVRWNGSGFTSTSTGVALLPPAPPSTQAGNCTSADVNADGRSDLICLSKPGLYNTVYLQLNTSTGGTVSFSSSLIPAFTSNSTYTVQAVLGNNAMERSSVRIMDFNGDNKQDIAALVYYPATNIYTYAVFLSSGTTFSMVPVNGNFLPVNFNNDNCTDMVSGTSVYIWGCNGASAQTVPFTGNAIMAMDYDGDGRTDIWTYATTSSPLQVLLSQGNSLSAAIPTTIVNGLGATQVTGDFDGDAMDDIVLHSGAPITYGFHSNPGVLPDLATSFTDGFGNSVSPSYVSIARGAHTKGSGAVLPEQDIQDSRYVVNQAVVTDGTGGTFTQTFAYTGARRNIQGRGFEGFQTRKVSDNRSASLVSQTMYQQAFPLTGMVSQDDVLQNNGTSLVVRSMFTNNPQTVDTTAANQRYVVTTDASSVERREVGGAKDNVTITTTATSYTYDAVGNATTVATTVTDKDVGSPTYNQAWSVTTVSTISPDTSVNWCLSLPTRVAVTNTAPGVSAITRTTDFTPDYVKCRATAKIVEPSSSTYKVTEGYTFDSFGNVSQTDVTGIGMTMRTSTVNWGTTGQFPMSARDPVSMALGTAGYKSVRSYDFASGVLLSQTVQSADGTVNNAPSTSWQYDAFFRKTKEIRLDGTATTWGYNDCTVAGCLGSNNKMTIVETVLNVDLSPQTDRSVYLDKLDRMIGVRQKLLDGTYSQAETRYDAFGNVKQQSFPCAAASCSPSWASTSYDPLQRPVNSDRPIDSTTGATFCDPAHGSVDSGCQRTSISYQGRFTVQTDPQGKASTTIASVVGTMLRTQDNDGYYQSMGYDAFGSLLSVVDSSGNTLLSATYDYGIQAFQRTTGDVDRGSTSTTYNALGEVTAYTNANGEGYTAVYDGLSRMTSRTETVSGGGAERTVGFTWGSTAASHNVGALSAAQATGSALPSWQETYTYDVYARRTQAQFTEAGSNNYYVNWDFDANSGLLDALTYPTSTSSYRLKLKYAYLNGQLASIKDFNALTTVFWQANSVNPRGQVLTETLGNGLATTRAFDAVTGLLGTLQSSVGATSIQNLKYFFDKVGNLTQRQDVRQSLAEVFSYDNLYRLQGSTLNGTTNLGMAYNAVGNITNKSDLGGYTYDPSKIHAMKTVAGGGSIGYDSNGSMTTAPGLGTNTWYASGLLKKLDAGGGYSSTFYYGPDNQRFEHVSAYPAGSDTTVYIGGLVEKVTTLPSGLISWKHYISGPTGPVALYIRKSSGSPAAMAYYLTKDHQGSIDSITNDTGVVQVRLSYSPFGERRKEAGWAATNPTAADWNAIYAITHRGFTFHETLDDLGVVHMNGRVYDATSGRFLSADPFIPDAGFTQSYNRYSYVNNNPLSFNDPSGFCPDPTTGEITVCGKPEPPCDFRSILCGGGPGILPPLSDPWPSLDEQRRQQEEMARLARLAAEQAYRTRKADATEGRNNLSQRNKCKWNIGSDKSLAKIGGDNVSGKVGFGATLYGQLKFGFGKVNLDVGSLTMGYKTNLSHSESYGYYRAAAPGFTLQISNLKSYVGLGSIEVRTSSYGEWPNIVQSADYGRVTANLTPQDMRDIGKIGGAVGFKYFEAGAELNLSGLIDDLRDYFAGDFLCTE